jgi:hypothetical protein
MKAEKMLAIAWAGVLVLILTTTAVAGQGGASKPAPAPKPAAPAPRLSDGKPDFSGVWWSGGVSVKDNTLAELERLYTPEARRVMQTLTEDDDPTLRCVPYGYPRAMTLPSNQQLQVVHKPGLMVILNEYFHSFRVVPTDGRKHPDDLFPTYLGDSVARWDGDTLVVDVTGFNGKIWLADGADKPTPTSTGGWFTSDALHVVERWRRVDMDTLEYQATVEDSKVLTGPWKTPAIRLKRAPDDRIEEAMCLDTTTYSLTEKGRQERSKP